MSNKSFLYFVALIPAEPMRGEINSLKLQFSKTFHAKHALKSPPHITVIPPFNMYIKNHEKVTGFLTIFARSIHTFDISILGYGAFVPRVIYLKVRPNLILQEMQKSLSGQIGAHLEIPVQFDKPFTPHISLAFRDLSSEMFYKAWKIFEHESFAATFTSDRLFLLRHNGNDWDIADEFYFNPILPS